MGHEVKKIITTENTEKKKLCALCASAVKRILI